MPQIRSFQSPNLLTDYTPKIMLLPNVWGIVRDMGLFEKNMLTGNMYESEREAIDASFIQAQPWGVRYKAGSNSHSEMRNFFIPTHNRDDLITVGDITNKRQIGTANTAETLASVQAKKMMNLRFSYAMTYEYAMCQAIQGNRVNGGSGLPSGTWYDEYGIASIPSLDMKMNDASVSQLNQIQKIRRYMGVIAHNGIQGAGAITVICTTAFFDNLNKNPELRNAYENFAAGQGETNLLRDSLAVESGGRVLVWQGVRFVEYIGNVKINGKTVDCFEEDVDSGGRGWVIPSNSREFLHLNFAPRQTLSEVNKVGTQELYINTYADPRGHQVEILSESNFEAANHRPEMILNLYGNAKV